MRFRKILVPTDFSANAQLAFNAAYHLARSTGAGLDLLHVQPESDFRIAVKEELIKRESTEDDLQAAVEELQDTRFAEVTAGLGPGTPVRCVMVRGATDKSIIEYALENRADLMVVGMRGMGAGNKLRTALLGSVAEAMIRNSPCPVLVVRPDHDIEQPTA